QLASISSRLAFRSARYCRLSVSVQPKLKLLVVTMATTTTKKMPPGCLLSFPDSAEQLTKLSEDLIAESTEFYNRYAGVSIQEAGVANFARPLAEFDARFALLQSGLDFVQHVFPDKAMRDASSEADKKISEHQVDIEMRKDLYDRFAAVQDKLRTGGDSASAELTRYIERCVTDGRRNGLGLDEATRDRVKAIKTEMSSISIEFNRNLSEDVSSLLMDRAELAGLPDDFLDSLEKDADSGKLRVTLNDEAGRAAGDPAPDRAGLQHALQGGQSGAAAAACWPCAAKRAKLLNYPTHADYALELRMAKNADTVAKFLSNLSEKLKPLQAKERARLLEVKRADCDRLGIPFDDVINPWDVRYFSNQVERLDYSVDHERLRQYFPIEKVTKGLLEIYQRILGLKFTQVTDCWVWNPDVTLYNVEDSATGEQIGYFYLDLYPRDGKYGHAACFGLQPSCLVDNGTNRTTSICAVVANFTKPTPEKPSLLTHDEVETFFHEFGHAMHNLCARTETYMFSGTSVERDFVEAPSQMLENWVWSKKSLALMSGHYSTGEPIPDDLLQSLVASRLANTAFLISGRLCCPALISPDPNLDICAEYARISNRILGIQPSEGSAFPANFGHLAGGYDAQYYGYMWSEVYSADMFCTGFGEDKVLSPEAGAAYRRCILQPGGSRDAVDMLRDFLGRDPTDAAFLKMKGL
uniref:Peptidase_M3 domain-containing protein n=1 Tax=Macrostomum lignano TaxID=282301 RepID=A0A1I8IXK9_9PLAT